MSSCSCGPGTTTIFFHVDCICVNALLFKLIQFPKRHIVGAFATRGALIKLENTSNRIWL